MRGAAEAVHEHDAAGALDDRADDGHGVAPVHEVARGTREPLEAAAQGAHERRAAQRAILELRRCHRPRVYAQRRAARRFEPCDAPAGWRDLSWR